MKTITLSTRTTKQKHHKFKYKSTRLGYKSISECLDYLTDTFLDTAGVRESNWVRYYRQEMNRAKTELATLKKLYHIKDNWSDDYPWQK